MTDLSVLTTKQLMERHGQLADKALEIREKMEIMLGEFEKVRKEFELIDGELRERTGQDQTSPE